MLSVKNIISNPEKIVESLKVKNFKAEKIVEKIVELDVSKRNLQKQIEDLRSEQNNAAKSIGKLMAEGKKDDAESAKQKSTEIKDQIKILEAEFLPIDSELEKLVLELPNLPHESVPKGKSADDNLEIRTGGQIPKLPENKLPHWDLAKKYNLIDFDLGNKITGSGFPVYVDKGARLQRALITYFLDKGREAGFTEYMPPLMVNTDTAYATGQLPDKEGQMYHMEKDGFYMIPTAEVPLTNIYRDVILEEVQLPIKLTGYTPCFRREAGAYGKDVRGLNRLHQFDKVEIVSIEKPENSYKMLDEMVSYVESLIKSLGLPYRILRLCGGDLSFTSALTYDFEVFSAGQDRWLEVSSVSNFETFQSNRLKLRYKVKGEKQKELVHTLNGSALALPRILAALLENNQTENGIKIPDVLVPYLGFDVIS
ncbi:MAG: serine--tRNA ligase [Bacteroidales bacterium]|nr:serine--tRNA ligase [Bacteroidales bacterium]